MTKRTLWVALYSLLAAVMSCNFKTGYESLSKTCLSESSPGVGQGPKQTVICQIHGCQLQQQLDLSLQALWLHSMLLGNDRTACRSIMQMGVHVEEHGLPGENLPKSLVMSLKDGCLPEI